MQLWFLLVVSISVQLSGTLWASWASCKALPSATMGKFSIIRFSKNFSTYCSSFFPSATSRILMLQHLRFSWTFLSLSSLCWIVVSSFCSAWRSISSFCSKLVHLSPAFLPISVGSLNIFPLFLFSYPAFLPLFCDPTQPILWACRWPAFWTVTLIGWLTLNHLALFFQELWSLPSFGPFLYLFQSASYVEMGRGLLVHQGNRRGCPVSCMLWRVWEGTMVLT